MRGVVFEALEIAEEHLGNGLLADGKKHLFGCGFVEPVGEREADGKRPQVGRSWLGDRVSEPEQDDLS